VRVRASSRAPRTEAPVSGDLQVPLVYWQPKETCLNTEETAPFDPDRESKLYAPGVGVVTDGSLVLVSYMKR
jgi:hypothetical protein